MRRAAAYLALALLLARPLYPSEDAVSGTGLLWVVLLCLPAIAWLLAWFIDGTSVKWNWSVVDLPLLALLVWLGMAGLTAEAKGPAAIMLVEWIGMGLAFWTIRSIVLSVVSRRQLAGIWLGLATALGAYAIYQAFWGLEQLRVEFEQNREEFLRQLGIAPGSPEEQTFVNRLNSHEAFGTFALANSLAGFLVPWAVVAGAVVLGGAWRGWRAAVALGAALSVLAGLVLTQSRSALLALVAAAAVVALRFLPHLSRRQLAAVATSVALTVVVLVAVGRWRGKFDEQFLTGAIQSFEYRLQYWRATLAMVEDHPWLGVGPGNFRSYYLRYKDPLASEEVADPHNAVLELAAVGGVPAAGLFLLLLTLAMTQPSLGVGDEGQERWWLALATPAAAGLFAWWIGGGEPLALASLSVIWGPAAWALHRVSVPQWVWKVAIAALLVHWMFAGGIQYPGVALVLWAALAMALPDRWVPLPGGPLGAVLGVALLLVSTVGMTRGIVVPTLEARALVMEARQDLAWGNWTMAVSKLRRATGIASRYRDAWAERSRTELALAMAPELAELAWPHALEAALGYRRADPPSPWPYRDIALVWALKAEREGNPRAWGEALRWIREARRRYPSDLRLAYIESKFLFESGRLRAAAQLARETLRRNDNYPHPDRRLTPRQVQNLRRWAGVQK